MKSNHSNSNRVRLTITLKKDLLDEVDQVIDGSRIRNRSHAIEFFLTRSLDPGVRKAFILAGGYGIKMRPFTYELPKPMILVKGRPILEYIIQQLRDAGIRDIVILIGPLGQKIIEYFGDGSAFGINIIYIQEDKPSGTGGSLKKGEKLFKERFVLFYGDVLADINLHDFIDFHKSSQSMASVALSTAIDSSDYGWVKMRGNKIVDFLEKPDRKNNPSGLVSAGIYVFEPSIFEYLPERSREFSLEKEVFPKLIKIGKITGYPFEGRWYDVSTPETYERVIKEW